MNDDKCNTISTCEQISTMFIYRINDDKYNSTMFIYGIKHHL